MSEPTNKELLARIEQLEAQLEQLRARVAELKGEGGVESAASVMAQFEDRNG